MIKTTAKAVITGFLLLLLTSCPEKEGTRVLQRQDLFTLSLGTMDDELDFFSREGVSFSLKTDIFMKDGFYYIANGNGRKVMKFTSFGNLLQKIPSETRPEGGLELLGDNRWSFNMPGRICISSEDKIYVEDTLPKEKHIVKIHEKDQDKNVLYSQVVLIFDNNGDYQGYIGKEGLGGTPFFFIEGIYINDKDELIVVSKNKNFWEIYRYSEKGSLIKTTKIDLDYLPVYEDARNTVVTVAGMVPDRNSSRLLINLSYYENILDKKTKNLVSVENVANRIYYYDMDEDEFISFMEIPRRELGEDGKEEYTEAFEFLGIVQSHYLFFVSPYEDDMQKLIITNENGYILNESLLSVEDSSLLYKKYYITDDGILTALFCTNVAGAVVYWRTDDIIKKEG